jgi:hypothetical protein
MNLISDNYEIPCNAENFQIKFFIDLFFTNVHVRVRNLGIGYLDYTNHEWLIYRGLTRNLHFVILHA